MKIGEVAKRCGLSVKTVRYYHDIGLVRAQRADNGYRSYSQAQLDQLRFLGNCRKIGFSLEQCEQLLSLYVNKNRASSDVRRIANAHLSEIEERIAQLSKLRDSLHQLVGCCAGNNLPDCPILDSLAGHSSLQ
ncbi:Cu(I)-responsive transcriptional regulator [Celerinatantimonas sp. MCCC 1A17872]|uniref:Cu(I)-responsive transcriptional regulator n=1 Tax=Celerinatantimonas sp. MCCC 1A17872 TaxID=3177514 RepID=UPI0038BFA16F